MAITKTIKHRRGTTIEWETRNPILKEAEFGVNLDTGRFKIGDGQTNWNDLPYSLNEDSLEDIEGIQGPPGLPGQQGIQGEQGPEGPRGLQGEQGPEGPQGVQGNVGTPGTSMTIVDQVQTIDDLPASAGPSEGYLLPDGSLYFYGATSGWTEVGDIRGPEGPQGLQGPQGVQGEVGPTGLQGPRGEQGVQGIPGLQGQSITTTSHAYSKTTDTLAYNESVKTTITMAKVFMLHHIQTSGPARVRLYLDSTSQDSDYLRAVGVDPNSSTGLLLDAVTTGFALAFSIAPSIFGALSSSSVPVTVTNLGGSGAVTVTLTAIALE